MDLASLDCRDPGADWACGTSALAVQPSPEGNVVTVMTETQKEPPRPPGSTDAVRGARTTGHVRWILGISVVLVIAAFVLAYLIA
jgi:hypothetical protein